MDVLDDKYDIVEGKIVEAEENTKVSQHPTAQCPHNYNVNINYYVPAAF